MELRLPQHLSVVAMEKGTFGSPSTTVANFTYFYALRVGTGSYVTEATKTFFCVKIGVFDYSTVTRLLKDFYTGCKDLNELAKSCGPKSLDSKAVL